MEEKKNEKPLLFLFILLFIHCVFHFETDYAFLRAIVRAGNLAFRNKVFNFFHVFAMLPMHVRRRPVSSVHGDFRALGILLASEREDGPTLFWVPLPFEQPQFSAGFKCLFYPYKKSQKDGKFRGLQCHLTLSMQE